jgi:hypothetical protein
MGYCQFRLYSMVYLRPIWSVFPPISYKQLATGLQYTSVRRHVLKFINLLHIVANVTGSYGVKSIANGLDSYG